MKIWISKNSEVTIHDQLVIQIKMGIASRDLLPAEKLPSTRELARRFSIHQNTVSAAYRELSNQGFVQFRKGSGVYVHDGPVPEDSGVSLEHLFARFVSDAAAHGFSPDEIRSNVRNWLTIQPAAQVLVIESDPELRAILVDELSSQLSSTIRGASVDDLRAEKVIGRVKIAALFDEKDKLNRLMPRGEACVYLEVNSVPKTMAGAQRPSKTELVAVISGWDRFIDLAKLYLLAASIDPESLIIRSPKDKDWRNGLDSASLLVCDSCSARHFAGDPRLRIFRLVTDSSIEKLRHSLL